MRISIIIFITIILLGIGIYYVWQKGIPHLWAKGKIISECDKRINGKLKIKSVYFKLPNYVILEGIKLTTDKNPTTTTLGIKRIVCKYNLFAPIIHLGRLETGVSQIVIVEPYMYLYRDKTWNWNFASLFKPLPKPIQKPPKITLLVKDATLSIKDEIFGTQTTISNLYLSYHPHQEHPPYFYLRMGHQVKIRGNIYKLSPLQASFNLRIIKKDISSYAGFLRTKWANLLQGQVSGNIRGKLEDKKINLRLGNLSIKKGLIKLANFPQPISDISGNFLLAGRHSLITNNLKFKFRDIEIKVQKFYMNDIYKNEALITFVSSKFYLKELGDIIPYLNKLNLRSVVKFNGGIDFKHSLSVFGEAELINQIPSGYKFPIIAKFKYKDKIFDNISLLIDKNTYIEGKFDIQEKLKIHLTTKFDKSNILPLSVLLGRQGLEKGTITGEIMVRGELEDIQYKGDLKLALNEHSVFKEITTRVEGDEESITFTSQLIQPEGKINIQGEGKRETTEEPFSLSLTTTLKRCRLFNKEVYANISFDGKLSTKTKLIGGQIKAEDIIIDHNSYPNWQGSVIYDYPDLNISTSPQIEQLVISGKITFKEPITTSIEIKTKNTNLSILTNKVKGVFDGEFNLTSKAKTTICGKSIKINLSDGRIINGNFELIKMKDKIYIEHLVLNEPQKMNISIKGKVDLTSKQAGFIDLEGGIYELKYKNLAINTYAGFKGHLSTTQLSGVLNLTGGKINEFAIDNGAINFSCSNQKIVIKESGIVLDRGGILTVFGSCSTTGKLNLQFSLLGMDYQDIPYAYFKPFKGQFDIIGKVKGDINNPIILASLEAKGLTIANEKIDKISGRIHYSNNKFRIVDLKINDNLVFQGTFRHPDKYISGLLQIKGEKASILSSMFSLPHKNLHGIVKGQIKGKGLLNNLILHGAIEIEDFHIPGFDATYGEIKFTLNEKTLSFKEFYFIQADGGRIDLKKYQLELKPDGKVIMAANMDNLIIANTIFDGKIYFTGIGTPFNKTKGVLTTKNLLINQSDTFKKLAVEIYYENGLLEFIPLPNPNSLSGKVKFISNEKLEIKEIKVLKSNVEELKINGSVELLARRCDLRFIMDNSDLKFLPLWFREVKRPEGKVDGWLHVGGDFDEPKFNGALMLNECTLTTFPFAKRLTNLSGQIRIVNNCFVSNFLKANIGKSTLVMKSDSPFTLKNIDIEVKNFHKPIPVSIPGFLEGGVDVDIRIKGEITSPIGSGNIRIVNGRFTYPPKTKTKEGKIQWKELVITVGKNVRYYNEYVDVEIKRKDSWIKVSTQENEIWVDGIVYARPRGKVNYLGKNFTIKRAYLEFRERHLPPYLSAYAVSRLGARQIALTYEGYIGEAKPTLQAVGGYPPMNEEQIVNALLIGKTDYTPMDSDMVLRAAFDQVVGKEIVFSLLIPIEKQISQLLGVDVEFKTSALEHIFREAFREDKDLIEEERFDKSTSIFAESEFRIGKFIADDVYVSYRGILKPWEEEEFARLKLKQEFELEYYLSGNTSLKYKFIPEGVWQKGNEYEVTVEREVRF